MRAALIQASVFPLTGGLATGLWLENWIGGVAAYYALLALALASPQGQPLRQSFRAAAKSAAAEGETA